MTIKQAAEEVLAKVQAEYPMVDRVQCCIVCRGKQTVLSPVVGQYGEHMGIAFYEGVSYGKQCRLRYEVVLT